VWRPWDGAQQPVVAAWSFCIAMILEMICLPALNPLKGMLPAPI
jgi:hypothetical protein